MNSAAARAESPDTLASPPAQVAKRSTPRVPPPGVASHLLLGEHNAAVYGKILGCDGTELLALRRDGVI